MDEEHVAAEPLKALVVGATGLVGAALLEELLGSGDYETVRALVRRPLPPHEKLDARIVDFENPESWLHALEGVAHVFCTLGTTIKRAGSEVAFRRVDLELPLQVARRARECGATALFVVTALGADPASRLFYNRVKGELERQLETLDYPTLCIFRPSLLVGERNEPRPAERLGVVAASAVAPLLVGGLRKYRPIAARDVARAMATVASTTAHSRDPLGKSVYLSDAVFELSSRGASSETPAL